MTYKVQIDDEVRDATAEEAALIQAQHAEEKAKADLIAETAAKKAAVLERLGITEDEAKALLS